MMHLMCIYTQTAIFFIVDIHNECGSDKKKNKQIDREKDSIKTKKNPSII